MYRYNSYNSRKCSCNQSNLVNGATNNSTSQNIFPENFMYGQSYVPIQYIDKTFEPAEGLRNGTIFPELVSPYNPGEGMRDNQYLRNQS